MRFEGRACAGRTPSVETALHDNIIRPCFMALEKVQIELNHFISAEQEDE